MFLMLLQWKKQLRISFFSVSEPLTGVRGHGDNDAQTAMWTPRTIRNCFLGHKKFIFFKFSCFVMDYTVVKMYVAT